MRPRSIPLALLLAASLLVALGCGGDESGGMFSDKPPPPPPKRGVKAEPTPDGGVDAGPPALTFVEQDFVESDKSRDPFRSFAQTFVEESESSVRAQRDVLLEQYSVDDLKLVGIVTRIPKHRAMLVDPTGKGWVVTRGQFLGKPEVVRGTGPDATDYELHWRVDRIRDGDIVLVRQDTARSDIPPATRIIPLRPDDKLTGEP